MVRAHEPAPPRDDVQVRLGELKARDAELAATLQATRAERRKLAAQIRALEAHSSLSARLEDPDGALRLAALQGGTIADAAALLLEERGPMRVIELLTILQDAGKLRRSEWAYSTLFTTLARDERFARNPGKRGIWRIGTPAGKSRGR